MGLELLSLGRNPFNSGNFLKKQLEIGEIFLTALQISLIFRAES